MLEKYEVGISLRGAEVKEIKKGNIDLSHSYAKLIGDEAFLINANVPVKGTDDYKSTRTRKLLLHRDELTSINAKIKAKKLTLVPTKVYTRGPFIKLEIALAKTKKKFEKKELLRKKDIEREVERQLKDSIKV